MRRDIVTTVTKTTWRVSHRDVDHDGDTDDDNGGDDDDRNGPRDEQESQEEDPQSTFFAVLSDFNHVVPEA